MIEMTEPGNVENLRSGIRCQLHRIQEHLDTARSYYFTFDEEVRREIGPLAMSVQLLIKAVQNALDDVILEEPT